WVKGLKINWLDLYALGGAGSAQGPGQGQAAVPTASALPHRISLPTYPFARERYWLPALPVQQTSSNTATVTSPRGCISLRSSGASSSSTLQPIALRPLVDGPVPLGKGTDEHSGDGQGQAAVPTVAVSSLEEELARSLAQALHMQESEIDAETPFVE